MQKKLNSSTHTYDTITWVGLGLSRLFFDKLCSLTFNEQLPFGNTVI